MSDYPSDWGSRRDRVLQRDNYQCQHCKAKAGSNGNIKLNAHHIVPKSKGGEHHPDNLQTLCQGCHNAIHGSSMAPTPESRRNGSYGDGTRSKSRSSSHKKLKDTVYETTNGTKYSVKYGSHPSHRTVELYNTTDEKPYKEVDPEDMSTEEGIVFFDLDGLDRNNAVPGMANRLNMVGKSDYRALICRRWNSLAPDPWTRMAVGMICL